ERLQTARKTGGISIVGHNVNHTHGKKSSPHPHPQLRQVCRRIFSVKLNSCQSSDFKGGDNFIDRRIDENSNLLNIERKFTCNFPDNFWRDSTRAGGKDEADGIRLSVDGGLCIFQRCDPTDFYPHSSRLTREPQRARPARPSSASEHGRDPAAASAIRLLKMR